MLNLVGLRIVLDTFSWDSYQNLSEKLLLNIEEILKKNKLNTNDLDGIIVYLGPGSYTGLRIGVTTANAMAYSLSAPVAGVRGKSLGKKKFEIKSLRKVNLDNLLKEGMKNIREGRADKFIVPFYGKRPNTGENNKRHP